MTIRTEHAKYCADPDAHALIGSPDDGSGLPEDWCISEVIEDGGTALQLIDSPTGPAVMQMVGQVRMPAASWTELVQRSLEAFTPHVPAQRRSAENPAPTT
ncbi:hypothetical protein [Kineosporia babensis]|uniref:Uncharacterized protein n=1 Tax=Kineosporia babensis TaxID=499548 RepID=A0A9X1STS6_9ACTN|nr:hypothetical protein [Kineosporia babensis]MCD5310870.1 hypothetical protein [Kineosporia babensis]